MPDEDDEYGGGFGSNSYDRELAEIQEAIQNPPKSKRQRDLEKERELTDSLGGAMLRDPFDEE
jgi:hypothetical protein